MNDNCFSALGWTPESQRVRQRTKTTWTRTIERKRNKAGKSWKKPKRWHGTESVGQKA